MRDIQEGLVLLVAVERKHLLIYIGDKEILKTCVEDVTGIHTHPRPGPAFLAVSNPRREAHLFELPFAGLIRSAVQKEKVLNGIVGDEQIHPPIVVDVRGDDSESFAQRLGDIGARLNLSKGAVAIIVIEKARRTFEDPRNAVEMLAEFVVSAGEVLFFSVIDK